MMKTKTLLLLMALAALWIFTVAVAVDQVRTVGAKLEASEKEVQRLRSGLSKIGHGLSRIEARNEELGRNAERLGELLSAGRTRDAP